MKRWPIFLIWLALWLLPPIALARMGWAIITGNIRRAWSIALAFDFLGNAASNDSPRRTISSRAAHARAEGKRWGCLVCDDLDKIDKGHCNRALTAKDQNLK